jgi:hypothetical protein
MARPSRRELGHYWILNKFRYISRIVAGLFVIIAVILLFTGLMITLKSMFYIADSIVFCRRRSGGTSETLRSKHLSHPVLEVVQIRSAIYPPRRGEEATKSKHDRKLSKGCKPASTRAAD